MAPDVVDLRDFYDGTLGLLATRIIRARLRALWPDVRGDGILGLGYATPYLPPFRGEASRIIALMPAAQGVVHWPVGERGLVGLAEEAELPLPDLSVDRIVMVHGIEFSEQLRPLLREVWRVLSDRGRLLVVAPNRRGIWALLERTPFGQGHTYTQRQLSLLLRENMFTPLRATGALYVPPVRSRMLQATARVWERLGDPWLERFSGVVVVEAGKQIYAAGAARSREKSGRRVYVPVPGGLTRTGVNSPG